MTRQKTAVRPPVHLRILALLGAGGRPMTAYQLLNDLRDEGITAPPTVYRALNRLISEGRAHRLESLNAFVACSRPAHSGCAGFAICDGCGQVTEFTSEPLIAGLATWAAGHAFRMTGATIEVKGRCADCGDGRTPAPLRTD
jgi:Fur family zinc uptake transcriptional regulator